MSAVCPNCHGDTVIGGVCQACDGQVKVLAYEIADAIAERMGPRRRDSRRINQFGGKATIKYKPTDADINAGIRQTATIVDWQSEDGLPRQVTVDVGRIASGGAGTFPRGFSSPGNLLSYRAFAQVIFGTPAAMHAPFSIDIGRGQRFTCSASYVAITAQMNPPANDAPSGSMVVVGTLGYGTSPSLAPVLFTEYADGVSPANPRTIVIPERANVLLPVLSANFANTTNIAFRSNDGVVLDVIQFVNGTMPEVFIPADAYDLVITNLGGVPAAYRLPFQISV